MCALLSLKVTMTTKCEGLVPTADARPPARVGSPSWARETPRPHCPAVRVERTCSFDSFIASLVTHRVEILGLGPRPGQAAPWEAGARLPPPTQKHSAPRRAAPDPEHVAFSAPPCTTASLGHDSWDRAFHFEKTLLASEGGSQKRKALNLKKKIPFTILKSCKHCLMKTENIDTPQRALSASGCAHLPRSKDRREAENLPAHLGLVLSIKRLVILKTHTQNQRSKHKLLGRGTLERLTWG